jgi:hypothetical protein
MIAGNVFPEAEQGTPSPVHDMTLLDTQDAAGNTLVWRGASHSLPADVAAFWDAYTRRIKGDERQRLEGPFLRAVPAHVCRRIPFTAKKWGVLWYSSRDEERLDTNFWLNLETPNRLEPFFGKNRRELEKVFRNRLKIGGQAIIEHADFRYENKALFIVEVLPLANNTTEHSAQRERRTP